MGCSTVFGDAASLSLVSNLAHGVAFEGKNRSGREAWVFCLPRVCGILSVLLSSLFFTYERY